MRIKILIVSCLIGLQLAPFAALAARTVQGTVPVIPPLQPAPQNVKPNLSGNVDYGKTTTAPAESSRESKNEPASIPVQAVPKTTDEPGGSSVWIWIFSAFSAALIAAAYWFYRKDKLPKKSK
ncbi:MAG: hypothetical protein ACM3NH_00130 [Candidatus Saccharibacteria bacterium]